MATSYRGGCHCGAIGFHYTTDLAPSEWSVRACQCSFCRAHGARTTSDPSGKIEFVIARREHLTRYRFALRTADFLVCASCGVYIAAMITTARGVFATVNVNTIEPEPLKLCPTQAVSYDDEIESQRTERREQRWTPVVGAI